jgi:hypothetical protein
MRIGLGGVLLHALDEVAAVDEVVPAQGEAEQELRVEVGDEQASRGKR